MAPKVAVVALLCVLLASHGASEVPTLKDMQGTWTGLRTVTGYAIDDQVWCIIAGGEDDGSVAALSETATTGPEGDSIEWDADVVIAKGSDGTAIRVKPSSAWKVDGYEPLAAAYNATVTSLDATTGEATTEGAFKSDEPGCVRWAVDSSGDAVVLTQTETFTVTVWSDGSVVTELSGECPPDGANATCVVTKDASAGDHATSRGGKAPPQDYSEAFEWCLSADLGDMGDEGVFSCLSLMVTGLSGVVVSQFLSGNEDTGTEVADQITKCSERFAEVAAEYYSTLLVDSGAAGGDAWEAYRGETEACVQDMRSFFQKYVVEDGEALRGFCGSFGGLDCAYCAFCASAAEGSCDAEACTAGSGWVIGSDAAGYPPVDVEDVSAGAGTDGGDGGGSANGSPGDVNDVVGDISHLGDIDDLMNGGSLDDVAVSDILAQQHDTAMDVINNIGRRRLLAAHASGDKEGEGEKTVVKVIVLTVVTELECVDGACADL